MAESNFTVYRTIKPEKKDQSMEEEVAEEKVEDQEDDDDLAAEYQKNIRKANEIMRNKYEQGVSTEHGGQIDDGVKLEKFLPEKMTGRDAYFALMAVRMLRISQKYGRNLKDLHELFYAVSCDWDRLEEALEAQKESRPIDLTQWGVLEDLALMDERDSESFKHVVADKGEGEVEIRRKFLEMV